MGSVSGGPAIGGNTDGARLLSLLDAVADPERSKKAILELEERRAKAEDAEKKAVAVLAELSSREADLKARELNVSLDEGTNACDRGKLLSDEAALRERIDRVGQDQARERRELNELGRNLNAKEAELEKRESSLKMLTADFDRRNAALLSEQQRLEARIDRMKRAMLE